MRRIQATSLRAIGVGRVALDVDLDGGRRSSALGAGRFYVGGESFGGAELLLAALA